MQLRILKPKPRNRAQLIKMLRTAEKNNIIDANTLSMIEGSLQISFLQARDIMIPCAQTTIIYDDQSLQEMLPIVIESGHSRFPVLNRASKKPMGILLAKDLLNYCFNDKTFNLNDILRSAFFIPESKRLDILLQEFRKKRSHIAVVIDEYGNVAGIITIEDILEQIVGEIADEYDIHEDINIKQLHQNEYTIKALTTIEEFNSYFHTDFSNDEFDTIGGLITHHFGHLPKRDESITIDNLCFTVLHADNRRVILLHLTKK
ncbi:MAG: transporter associated domain-containing protein [Gammaproteobacteria bacterium]|jgi:magnesium and cobalt transporter